MKAISEIEKKLSEYEDQYISENKSMNEKIIEYIEKEKKYKEEILSLYNKIDELKLLSIKDNNKIKLELIVLKEENCQLKQENNLIQKECHKLRKELSTEKTKNDILCDKFNRLTLLYEHNEKEKMNIMKNNENIFKENELLSYCNNCIEILIGWIGRNLCIPRNYDLNDSIEIESNYYLNFDKLKECLFNARNFINQNNQKLLLEIGRERKKLTDLEIETNNILENIYIHLQQEIIKERYFDVTFPDVNNFKSNDKYLYINQIEDIINKIFSLLKNIKQSSNERTLDKLIEDNTLLNKEIITIKNKIIDLYNDNKALFNKFNESEKINKFLKQKLEQNNISIKL